MKPIVTIVLAFFTVATFAQKNFQGTAKYMSKRTMDMSRFGNQMSEQQKKQMMARMKNFLEKNFTLTFNKTESSFKEDVALEGPGTSGPSWGRSNGQGSIYKSTKDKIIVEDVEQFSKRFRIVEKMEQPKWQMSTETKKIGNYTCYKATMTIEDESIDYGSIFGRRGRGRGNKKKDSTATKKEPKVRMLNVTAWYSPQIPVSSGPDKYYGLPGLILELEAGTTKMLCTEISINTEGTLEIEEPKKGKKVDRDEYNKIIKEKTDELKEQFKNRGRRGGRGRF